MCGRVRQTQRGEREAVRGRHRERKERQCEVDTERGEREESRPPGLNCSDHFLPPHPLLPRAAVESSGLSHRTALSPPPALPGRPHNHQPPLPTVLFLSRATSIGTRCMPLRSRQLQGHLAPGCLRARQRGGTRNPSAGRQNPGLYTGPSCPIVVVVVI